MKYAILSDVHGNTWALKAVLEDAQRRGIGRYLNLGDLVYGPLKPKETYQALRKLEAATILGNQDRSILEATQGDRTSNPTLSYVMSELDEEALDWLGSFPKIKVVEDQIFLCHGTPDDDQAYLLEDVRRGFSVVKEEREIITGLGNIESRMILCGHSHHPRLVQLSTGQFVLNPGSVGLPAYDATNPTPHVMQTYSPHASYAVVENSGGGWIFELIRVPYDYKSAAEQARKNGREDWEFWLKTGRVK